MARQRPSPNHTKNNSGARRPACRRGLHEGEVMNRSIPDLIKSCCLAFCLLAICGTPAVSGEHGSCEDVRYATPGLYGLCIAYCEALDCDDESFRAASCRPPRESVLKNYNKKKEVTDPEMPCIADLGDAECPCFTADDLAHLHLDVTCSLTEEEEGNFLTVTGPACTSGTGSFDFVGASDFVRNSPTTGDSNTCFFRNVDEDDAACALLKGKDATGEGITVQQATKCYQILTDFCNP